MKSRDKSKPGKPAGEPAGNRQAEEQGKQNFVLVDTEHPEIDTADVPELEVRRVDRPLPGNRQSGEQGARQGERPGSEGGAPGEEASSGL